MGEYYWCLTHRTVEQGTVCRAADRLGPYETAEEARNWADRVESRNEAWEAEDRRWRGEDRDA